MKRDLEIVRKIIIALESSKGGISSLDGVDDESFKYNAAQMKSGELVDAVISKNHDDPELSQIPLAARIDSLTWKGSEFADLMKDDAIWEKAKSTLKSGSASISFSALIEAMNELAKKAAGL